MSTDKDRNDPEPDVKTRAEEEEEEDEGPSTSGDGEEGDGGPEDEATEPTTQQLTSPANPGALRAFLTTGPTWTEIVRDCYCTFDRRTLGFTRLLLGFYLIGDLVRRTWDWEAMFSTIGVLPSHVNLWRPSINGFTLLNAFSTPGELWVLWALILATYVGLFVGWKTKIMQVLSLLWVTSMNIRVGMIENGGYVVHNLLLLWTCFFPLGDRFSMDALLASMKRTRERTASDLNDRSGLDDPDKPDAFVSILGPVLLIQTAAIYFFNVLHKSGPAWKNGTAVHYVLYVDRMVTPLIAQIRDYVPNWMILFMTKTTLGFEAAIPICLLSTLARTWTRRAALVMMNLLHIAFGTVFVLGPFAWALCVWSTLLLGAADWEIAARTMRRAHRARTVLFDPRSAGALFVCRLLKRMDRFELLTFEEASALPGGLAVRTPAGAELTARFGALALADLVAAIPLGPVIAWTLRLPLVRDAVSALMAALYDRSAGRALGLCLPVAGFAPPPSPLRRAARRGLAALREVTVLAMFAAEVNQAMIELWVVNRRIRVSQPEPLRSMALKLRFLQGWFMFSPNPVMDDGTIVVDAITVDGRHIDPFTGEPPDFNLLDAKGLGYNQIWSDYFNRMHLPGFTTYREAMKEYIYRYPERTGRPEDTMVSGDVYWVKDMNPKWNTTRSYDLGKDLVFSFQNPLAAVTSPPPSEAPEADPAPPRSPKGGAGASPAEEGQMPAEGQKPAEPAHGRPGQDEPAPMGHSDQVPP